MQLPYYEWGVKTYMELSDGVIINDSAIHLFTHGQCHSLALAINKLTNWPILGLMSKAYETVSEMMMLNEAGGHVCVNSPKGFLDIEGLTVEERFEGRIPKPLTPEIVRGGLAWYLPVTENSLIDLYAKKVVNTYLPGYLRRKTPIIPLQVTMPTFENWSSLAI